MDEEDGGDGNTPNKAGGLPKRCCFAPLHRRLLPGSPPAAPNPRVPRRATAPLAGV